MSEQTNQTHICINDHKFLLSSLTPELAKEMLQLYLDFMDGHLNTFKYYSQMRMLIDRLAV